MPWRVHVATYNTVHGEDDIGYWLSGDASWGVVAVADGVSATSGGGASFLAVNAFIHACRVYGSRYRGVDSVRDCLDYVSRVAAAASPDHADVIEELKRRYYSRCGQEEPCTKPLSLDQLIEDKLRLPEQVRVHREGPPSTTLLGALLHGDRIAIAITGDGSVMGSTGRRKDEVYLLWGAIPQYFAGTKVARYVEIGRGVVGRPLVLEVASARGSVYAVATDGVDLAALADELASMLAEREEGEAAGNMAAEILKRLKAKTGFEDDATLAIIEHV